MLAVAHFAEAGQVVGRAAAAEGAVGAGGGEVAPVGAHLLGRLLVHVGVAGFDQMFRRAVHEIEVVAGEVLMRLRHAGVGRVVGKAVVPAEPLHAFTDGVDVLLLFLLGVGVVKAQVAHAAVVPGQAEVQPDALGVADVQVAVGLGREAGADPGRVRHAGLVAGPVARLTAPVAAGVGAGLQVVLDDLADEVAGGGGFRRGRGVLGGVHAANSRARAGVRRGGAPRRL